MKEFYKKNKSLVIVGILLLITFAVVLYRKIKKENEILKTALEVELKRISDLLSSNILTYSKYNTLSAEERDVLNLDPESEFYLMQKFYELGEFHTNEALQEGLTIPNYIKLQARKILINKSPALGVSAERVRLILTQI